MKQVRLALIAILIAAAGIFTVNARAIGTRTTKTYRFDPYRPLIDAKNAAFYTDITNDSGYDCIGWGNVCTVTFDDQNGTISLAQYLATFPTPADILLDPNTTIQDPIQ